MTVASDKVRIRGLAKSFGVHRVLHAVDLDVPSESVTVILGSSGSGKTTLLRLLAGLDRPDAGTIAIDGVEVEGPRRHVPPEVRRVGYVPQEGSLFPHLTVSANVGFGLPRAKRRPRVGELLELAGLGDLGRRYPHQLSGGQQQRVALARALAPNPPLVLLDEPFSSLDAPTRASVRLDVVDILRKAGTTAVIVTHDQDEALSTADRVVVLRDGAVAQSASPDEVYRRPVDVATARLVGDSNLLPGVVRSGGVVTMLGMHPLDTASSGIAEGCEVVALIRPEQIGLCSVAEPAAVACRVVRCHFHGHDTIVVVETDETGQTVRVRLAGPVALASGDSVFVCPHGPVTAWRASQP